MYSEPPARGSNSDMTIHLSKDLERSILSLVDGGKYASVDEAMNEAARLLLQQQPPAREPITKEAFHRHLIEIGLMSRLPDTDADYDDPDDQPIRIEGEPLSETVIRERR
jgi:Arc/MetJ-type ribon-helix-helix transcriptional regulator